MRMSPSPPPPGAADGTMKFAEDEWQKYSFQMRIPDGNVRYFCKLCQLQQSYARVELLKQHMNVEIPK